MGLFWFIVAVVFFLLWITNNSALKKLNKENYENGYLQGRNDLAASIRDVLKKKSSTPAGIKKIIDGEIETFEERVAVAEAAPQDVEVTDFTEYSQMNASITPAASYVSPTPAPSRTKKQDTERNMNVLLYMASFLIVAAAAAFIATSTPPLVRLTGLWLVIVAFYGTGLILHTKVPYLRPAATAFIGTGLALVPFAGVALSQLGGLSGGWSWFITSAIGIVSYFIAALRLKSQVVSYLTIAFTLSLAASSVATFSGPMVLYFVVLIVVSLLFHILARVDAKWIPELFKLPVSQTGQLLTPVTLLASLLAYDSMTLVSYQIVFWVASLYYLVLWLTERTIGYETATRILVSISAFVSTMYFYEDNATALQFCFLAVALIQSVYSILRVKLIDKTSRFTETSWLAIIIMSLIITLPIWIASDIAQLGIIIQTSVIFVISGASSYRFRNIFFAIPTLVASVILPFAIGRWPTNVLFTMEMITWIFLAGGALVTVAISYLVRNRSSTLRGFVMASFWVYISIAFFASFGQLSSLAYILSTTGIAATLLIASYVFRQWWVELPALILVIPIINLSLNEINSPVEWINVMTIGLSVCIYSIALLTHHFTAQTRRRNMATIAIVAIGIGLVYSFGAPDYVERTVFFLALFYTVLGLVLRHLVTSKVLQGLFNVTYAVYPLLVILFASGLGLGWVVIALLFTAAIYWLASYVQKVATITVFGNLAFIAAVASLWLWMKLDSAWFFFGVACYTSVVFYIASLIHTIVNVDSKRRYIHLTFVWILLGIVTVFNFASIGDYGYAAAGTLLAIAGTMIVEGIVSKRNGLVEMAIYVATFALQRIVGLSIPEVNIALYGHWWALIIFLVAFWRRGESFNTHLAVAMAFVTGSTGIMALTEGGEYQLLFLIEHIALLVTGALLRVSWALWWGLIASILAVVYFLRSSLFLSLLFLGLTLLGIVIWRLVRTHQK
ncbi:MAG: hypothetical protein V4611_04630 [Patescibacteria group bacterium]